MMCRESLAGHVHMRGVIASAFLGERLAKSGTLIETPSRFIS